MGKNKDQGTRWQTEIREAAKARGWEAWTIKEGGQYDYGDVAIKLPSGKTIIVEAKAREQLNIHATQDIAVMKVKEQSTAGRIPHSVDVVVTAWKRLVSKPDSARRVKAGEPVFALNMHTFFDLLDEAEAFFDGVNVSTLEDQ